MDALARALGVIDPVAGPFASPSRTGRSNEPARQWGCRVRGLARVADALMAIMELRPRALERAALTPMLEGAYVGAGAIGPSLASLLSRARETLVTQPGLGEPTTPRRSPRAATRQNAPRLCPYGLLSELVNGTPFTQCETPRTRGCGCTACARRPPMV